MAEKKKENDMVVSLSSSTEADVEYDIVKELKGALDDIEESLDESDAEGAKKKFPYLRFLVNDLDDALSGDFKNLRYRRFITKKTS